MSKPLDAGVPKSPAELARVHPVLDFSMVDPRSVEETEFEGLITKTKGRQKASS